MLPPFSKSPEFAVRQNVTVQAKIIGFHAYFWDHDDVCMCETGLERFHESKSVVFVFRGAETVQPGVTQ